MEEGAEKESVRHTRKEGKDVIEAKVGRSPFRDLEGGGNKKVIGTWHLQQVAISPDINDNAV